MPPTPEQLERARELFFEYDGSAFNMHHDGVIDEFDSYRVPRDVRRAWTREVVERRLAALDQPGNWTTLEFLWETSRYGHVREVLAAQPLGDWWDHLLFLELLIDYVRNARWLLRTSRSQLRSAASMALQYEAALRSGATDAAQASRVDALVEKAHKHA